MATLKKMTRIGADVRQIARLLQQKAPENHMLAYITPEEAQFLKDRGGSGMPDPETGIPSFQEEDFSYDMYGETATPTYSQPIYLGRGSPATDMSSMDAPSTAPKTYAYPSGVFANPESATISTSGPLDTTDYLTRESLGLAKAQPLDTTDYLTREALGLPSTLDQRPGGYQRFVDAAITRPDASRGFDDLTKRDVPLTPSVGDRFRDLSKSLGVKEDTLARMGLGGLQALLGARQARQAREDAQKAKEEQQKLAAPYQTKGAELQRQAQAGELTPVGQQQMQTVQAQAAQAATARGGVGAQQTAARVENLRNQLLQQQNDYGLKLSGIGDQILLGSIRTGLEADRYVNQLTTSYFTNIARTLVGAPTVIQYGVTQ